MHSEPIVIVTGGSGFIGRALLARLAERYRVVSLDRDSPAELPSSAIAERFDITSDESVNKALARVRQRFGDRIASVVHLAAYFDLTGEPNENYEQVTIRGTERLLRALQSFMVEQFVFMSTMLVHAAGKPGERIDENRPFDPKYPYRASKATTEQLVREEHGEIPVVLLRPAGVYDDEGQRHGQGKAARISAILAGGSGPHGPGHHTSSGEAGGHTAWGRLMLLGVLVVSSVALNWGWLADIGAVAPRPGRFSTARRWPWRLRTAGVQVSMTPRVRKLLLTAHVTPRRARSARWPLSSRSPSPA